jgi:hypothetical protein
MPDAEWTERDLLDALTPERRALFFTWLAERLGRQDFAEVEPNLRAIILWAEADPQDFTHH